MSGRSGPIFYQPLPGWLALFDQPTGRVIAYREEEKDEADDLDSLLALFGVNDCPGELPLQQALPERLKPHVPPPGEAEYVVPDEVSGHPAVRAEWTDGVYDVVWWLVDAPGYRVLVEYACHPRLKLTPLDAARECVAGLFLGALAPE